MICKFLQKKTNSIWLALTQTVALLLSWVHLADERCINIWLNSSCSHSLPSSALWPCPSVRFTWSRGKLVVFPANSLYQAVPSPMQYLWNEFLFTDTFEHIGLKYSLDIIVEVSFCLHISLSFVPKTQKCTVCTDFIEGVSTERGSDTTKCLSCPAEARYSRSYRLMVELVISAQLPGVQARAPSVLSRGRANLRPPSRQTHF